MMVAVCQLRPFAHLYMRTVKHRSLVGMVRALRRQKTVIMHAPQQCRLCVLMALVGSTLWIALALLMNVMTQQILFSVGMEAAWPAAWTVSSDNMMVYLTETPLFLVKYCVQLLVVWYAVMVLAFRPHKPVL